MCNHGENLHLAIYSDDGGSPDVPYALLGNTTVTMTSSNGWIDLAVPQEVAISEGTTYWLAYQGSDGNSACYGSTHFDYYNGAGWGTALYATYSGNRDNNQPQMNMRMIYGESATTTTSTSTTATSTSSTSFTTTSTTASTSTTISEITDATGWGSGNGSGNGGTYGFAYEITASGSGTLDGLGQYTCGAGRLSLGLYADSSGQPGTFLANTSIVSVSTGPNIEGVIQNGVSITEGDDYWIVEQYGSGAATPCESSSGGSTNWYTHAAQLGLSFPDPYSGTGQSGQPEDEVGISYS